MSHKKELINEIINVQLMIINVQQFMTIYCFIKCSYTFKL